MLEIERRSTGELVENSFWKRRWTCRKTVYGINNGQWSVKNNARQDEKKLRKLGSESLTTVVMTI